ncbi:MAG: hypothetical protein JNM80_02700 [Phycisphaerae bacterium]|nr:hypothetical protein [Phycisphaerae bacterium]
MASSTVKPWQIVVLVAALVVGGASAYYMFGSREQVNFAGEVLLVDVTTGDLFSYPVGGKRGIMIPAKNPETGKVALLSVDKSPEGKWIVGPRDLPALKQIEGEPKALVDRRTGEVRVSSEQPKRMK